VLTEIRPNVHQKEGGKRGREEKKRVPQSLTASRRFFRKKKEGKRGGGKKEGRGRSATSRAAACTICKPLPTSYKGKRGGRGGERRGEGKKEEKGKRKGDLGSGGKPSNSPIPCRSALIHNHSLGGGKKKKKKKERQGGEGDADRGHKNPDPFFNDPSAIILDRKGREKKEKRRGKEKERGGMAGKGRRSMPRISCSPGKRKERKRGGERRAQSSVQGARRDRTFENQFKKGKRK